MDSITHFNHVHPLNLQQIPLPNEYQYYCYACRELLHKEKPTDVYGCEVCKSYFLHKSCAQLPNEIVHKSHQKHSLFLLSGDIFAYGNCNSCRELKTNFLYHCSLCNFSLDINCAFKEKDNVVWYNEYPTFNHPSHKHHQLTAQPRPASFLCDACGVEDKDSSYHCSTCNYWIHKRYAMLPTTNTYSFHPHPVTLSFGLPTQYNNFAHKCDICGRRITDSTSGCKSWLYYCELCRYFVHIRCMKKKKPEINVDLKGLRIEDLPRLPMSDKSTELIQRYLLGNEGLEDIQSEISLFSHRHPLIYSNDQLLESEDGEDILCDACIEPIFSPPYYHCGECRYFLHLPCAKLPQQLQHSSHPHLLTLTCKTRFYETFNCDRCKRYSNGFYFHCTTERCKFILDLNCAALPNVIKHDYHKHPLFELGRKYKHCRGCDFDNEDFFLVRLGMENMFGCEDCRFYLDIKCLMLQKTTKHKYDSEHPLVLKFPPHAYHPEPFDCYQCDREINPYR